MKLCVMSDLHGYLPEDIQECDAVIICGDISPLDIQSNHVRCRKWLGNEFREWANNLPCERVIVIAGNHDLCIFGKTKERIDLLFKPSKITYLENSGTELYSKEGKLYRVYGTPDCHKFGNWAFMYSDEKLTEIYSQIPENIDILVTHDAPYGCSDVILQDIAWNTGDHIGCLPLREAILEKKPRYNFHGHLHSTNHEFEQLGDTKVVNTSIKDEYYEVVYQPLYLDID